MKSILIVDDENDLRLGLKEFLEQLPDNFNILTGANGREAVDVLASQDIDFILTDVKMPEMDGIELLAHIRANYSAIPVVVMSAFGTPIIKRKLEQLGSLRFLDKPVDFKKLTTLIRDELAHVTDSGYINNISPGSLLQLIELEEKTCLLEVEGRKEGKGYFYFDRGALCDALCSGAKGEEAAIKMLSWDKVQIRFKKLPKKKIKQRITSGILPLIIEGTRQRDEASGESG